MGLNLNEEISALNQRVASLQKKQEEYAKLLAVEEHKVIELATSLKEEGYEVVGMTEDQLEALSNELLTALEDTKAKLETKIGKVEALYEKLETLR